MENGMTNAEFNAFLEALAKLVESSAKTPAEAAEIIRQSKAKQTACGEGWSPIPQATQQGEPGALPRPP